MTTLSPGDYLVNETEPGDGFTPIAVYRFICLGGIGLVGKEDMLRCRAITAEEDCTLWSGNCRPATETEIAQNVERRISGRGFTDQEISALEIKMRNKNKQKSVMFEKGDILVLKEPGKEFNWAMEFDCKHLQDDGLGWTWIFQNPPANYPEMIVLEKYRKATPEEIARVVAWRLSSVHGQVGV